MPNPTQPLLRIDDVSVRFGGIAALDGVSFDVQAGQICGLIGPNGAGKSSLFNCLSRLYSCDSGAIEFDGHNLLALPRHRMAAIGIGRTFQNLALFNTMSVLDNVLVGCHARHHAGILRNAFRLPGTRGVEAAAREQANTLIEFLSLEGVASRAVGSLPFGTQKRVELARALAAKPKLLLLDEPACGLNHEEMASLGSLVLDVRRRFDVTVLLVEHHMSLVMGISDKVVALNFGRKLAEGTPAEVGTHPEVIKAYLGTDGAELDPTA
ncbi:ABC transporter ATP-binding protein [Ramlibacter sp. WS9]|uniref:ABC transporter ATP-binding protein n=1 Tax=Ramlibacter sp. WS9 TaxID=1882741 RepID=UPI001144600E|nr:ABC transporter ATP-binding protein [Ramlibacter sp. WS9]ROZ68754.1 ABC transporter ATP-binding protein [Ramlibacter sp. WS9]